MSFGLIFYNSRSTLKNVWGLLTLTLPVKFCPLPFIEPTLLKILVNQENISWIPIYSKDFALE